MWQSFCSFIFLLNVNEYSFRILCAAVCHYRGLLILISYYRQAFQSFEKALFPAT